MAHNVTVTLVGGVVSTVTLDQPYATITVSNDNADANPIFFTRDGATPTTTGGVDQWVLPKGEAQVTIPGITSIAQTVTGAVTGSVIKLISTGVPEVTVEGI